MTDYKVNFDVGYFGTDRASTPVVDRMPFVVQTDGKNKFVNIGIVSAYHGSHVAGIAAGHSLFGGRDERRRAGRPDRVVAGLPLRCGLHRPRAAARAMIYVAKQANADVINMSIGGLPALNDGNNTRCIVYERLIEQSKRADVLLHRQQRTRPEHRRRPGCLQQGHGLRRLPDR